ncbi:UDP-galactopyranose mutase [Roseovarius sp. S1116L3]|uniref:UDP-galactopyranose mutase n=1 Tax=Roseovarius roseus TaxID=3342636 RepID=UPI003727C2D8
MYEWVVIGAGFAGSVLAERIATVRGERVLLVDRRSHLGGNAHDRHDEHGILVHEYGPHIFHTNAASVFDYLSQWTHWRPYEHRVLSHVNGRYLPFPINLDTINALYDLDLDVSGMERFIEARREAVKDVRSAKDHFLATVGRELYEIFFEGYTRKAWGIDAADLDKSVASRIPLRMSRDDRYFSDRFQQMPINGYSAMFLRMTDHPKIDFALDTDWAELKHSRIRFRRLVFTGPIDSYFNYRFGPLPYRSLEFRRVTLETRQFQLAAVVNYPGSEPYLRVTEHKHLTGQIHRKTTLTYEYPAVQGPPFYPIPRRANHQKYLRYREVARRTPDVWFVGRLATYRYYNMDQVVAQALKTFARINAAVGRT